MSEEFLSFLEVGIGIAGINKMLAWQGVVFAGVVAVALGGYALIFSKIDSLEVSTAKIEERLNSIDATLQKIASDAGAAKTGVDQVIRQTASLQPDATPFKNIFEMPAMAGNGIDPKLVGTFFSNGGLGELKDTPDFKAAYDALSLPDQAAVLAECASAMTQGSAFCMRLSESRM